MSGVESYDEYVRRQAAAEEESEPGEERRQRAGRVQLAVTFRQADGEEDTFSYAHLYRVRVEAGNTRLVVEFSEHAVALTGRHLRVLARQVANHMADLVEASPDDRDFPRPGESRPVVHRIEIAPRTPEAAAL